MTSDAWASGAGPVLPGSDTVTLVEGMAFCISESSGDLRAGAGQGFFFRDTRFVSCMELLVDDQAVEPLPSHLRAPYQATFIGRRPPPEGAADSTVLVVRRRLVGNGLIEQITVTNLDDAPTAVALRLVLEADFAGLFEVKEGRAHRRPGIERSQRDSSVTFSVRDEDASRSVVLTGDPGAQPCDDGLAWALDLAAREERTVELRVSPVLDGEQVEATYPAGQPVEASVPARSLASWRANSPKVTTGRPRLAQIVADCIDSLSALRIMDPERRERVVVAAGAPWFMTLFGRDSLLTSWMLLPLDSSLAVGTLETLAELQGQTVVARTEEEPGRILHEVRSGLDAHGQQGDRSVYYGTVDATPLFVMLVGELLAWGVNAERVSTLLPNVDRALEWVTTSGDRDDDGFVEYRRATPRGLVNQGWKDSFDAINFADGTLAEAPIALAEVQGYAYAAYRARSRLAAAAGDDDLAHHWDQRADRLQEHFDSAYWMPGEQFYALALDKDKAQVDAITSNIGHCLWTGIVPQERAAAVADRLLDAEMFSGFGVRTLSAAMASYNPMSYHNGSVWPHDNAITAAGLMRYGFTEHAHRIAEGMLRAAEQLGGLPELFCGFASDDFDRPVPYPTSCSPQAWAAAAPLLLLRSLLRFDPDVPTGRLWCDPSIPPDWLPLTVEPIHLRGKQLAVHVSAEGCEVSGAPPDLEVLSSPRPLRLDLDGFRLANTEVS